MGYFDKIYFLMIDMINTLRRAGFSDDYIYYTFLNEHEYVNQEKKADLNWMTRFADKIFFAFILITTIGYGNVAAKTTTGQIVSVIYTIFGLPIHVITMRLFSVKFRGCLRKLFKVGQTLRPTSKSLLVVIGISFFLFWTILFIFLAAYVFTITDYWTYDKGVYYSFVTLSTIGLGDYVAGISHMMEETYLLEVIGLLIWMFLGLGFVTMAFNMLSYVFGAGIIRKLDCKCREREAARKEVKPLLDLVNEINWQLVKSKPENFHHWDEIENFKNILTENPHKLTPQLLLRMFDVTLELKEASYDHLSKLKHEIPLTPVIKRARDELPADSSRVPLDSDSVLPKTTTFLPSKRRSTSLEKQPSSSLQDEGEELVASTSYDTFIRRSKSIASPHKIPRHVQSAQDWLTIQETADLTEVSNSDELDIVENKEVRDTGNVGGSNVRTTAEEDENGSRNEDSSDASISTGQSEDEEKKDE